MISYNLSTRGQKIVISNVIIISGGEFRLKSLSPSQKGKMDGGSIS